MVISDINLFFQLMFLTSLKQGSRLARKTTTMIQAHTIMIACWCAFMCFW